jgi:hypothetical protein
VGDILVETAGQAEIPLSGGDVTEGVVRVGDTVRRPVGPHSQLVHALLAYLESAGFEGAPRFLGIDGVNRGRRPRVSGGGGSLRSAPSSLLVSLNLGGRDGLGQLSQFGRTRPVS